LTGENKYVSTINNTDEIKHKPYLAVGQKMPQLIALGKAGNFKDVFHPFF
jgi:hypothetical protein